MSIAPLTTICPQCREPLTLRELYAVRKISCENPACWARDGSTGILLLAGEDAEERAKVLARWIAIEVERREQ